MQEATLNAPFQDVLQQETQFQDATFNAPFR